MIDDRYVPAHIIRLYVWEILRQEEALKIVRGKVPIVPIEDDPELSDAGESYIIYGYSENETDIDQIRRGVLALRVIATTSPALDHITSVASRAFEDPNIATEALNIFSEQHGVDFEGIRFTYVKAAYIESADASESEGGPVEGLVAINYNYIDRRQTPVAQGITGGLWV